jgi:adenosylmethionine-8-amino-7-oxononanoate aminotransferase
VAETTTRSSWLDLDAAHLWHPWSPTRVNPDAVLAVAGEGCHVRDADGRTYLDAKSSGLNAALGYGCRPVVDAITAQLTDLMTYDLGEGSNVPAIRLAARIATLTAAPLERTFFCNSGSEAVEACIRIARFHHAARTGIVTLENGYHGSTMGAAAAAPGRSPVSPEVTPPGFTVLPGPAAGTHPLRAHLGEHGRTTAAIVIEPVQARGAHVTPDAYLHEVRHLCDEHGVLLVLDEVTTGFGRTGRMFAHEYAGVVPDLLATSKGLTAGYMSLGAVTTTAAVFDSFDRNKQRAGFVHGHTHSGHATACAAALAVLDVIEAGDVLANVRHRGEQLRTGLQAACERSHGRGLRGRGLLMAVALDSPRSAGQVRRLVKSQGVLVRRTGADIVIAPPLVISEPDIERIVTALSSALDDADRTSPHPGGSRRV